MDITFQDFAGDNPFNSVWVRCDGHIVGHLHPHGQLSFIVTNLTDEQVEEVRQKCADHQGVEKVVSSMAPVIPDELTEEQGTDFYEPDESEPPEEGED